MEELESVNNDGLSDDLAVLSCALIDILYRVRDIGGGDYLLDRYEDKLNRIIEHAQGGESKRYKEHD